MWEREKTDPRTVGGKTYNIQRYRPRIEGLVARIERWTNQTEPEDTFWRSISKDDITTWYGKTAESRIADPHAIRIFSWLIFESHDDKRYVIVYDYKSENSDMVDLPLANEHNRIDETRSANRYLKRTPYGNHQPYLPLLSADKPWHVPSIAKDAEGSKDWFFEDVFDYGEHDTDNLLPKEPGKKWPVRKDPFSSYRAGFKIRTYR